MKGFVAGFLEMLNLNRVHWRTEEGEPLVRVEIVTSDAAAADQLLSLIAGERDHGVNVSVRLEEKPQ
jgi:hypothetical protein